MVVTTSIRIDDPRYWHNRALEVRAQAQRTSDPRFKRMLTEIAQRYEELAKLTAEGGVVPAPPKRKRK